MNAIWQFIQCDAYLKSKPPWAPKLMLAALRQWIARTTYSNERSFRGSATIL